MCRIPMMIGALAFSAMISDCPAFEWRASHLVASDLARAALPEPLLIDLKANGFNLTNASAGVRFDLDGDGHAEQTAWTSPFEPDDAFLALDTIRTGKIENGRKLFGGLHAFENGFTTLQQYEQNPDLLREGVVRESGDGAITEADPLYRHLIVWVDSNHNGVAEGDEMLTASAAGILRLFTGVVGLNESDTHGNVFSYSAQALVKNRYGVPVATELRSVRFSRSPAAAR